MGACLEGLSKAGRQDAGGGQKMEGNELGLASRAQRR